MPGDSNNGHDAKGLFLVGRFRSGSTAIWNILRNIPGITAYYEPCHDGLIEHLEAQTAVDPTHIGISDYWQEYEAILEPLKRYFSRRFAVERLCLAEHDEHPELEAYFRFLLSSGGKGNLVALKLNRVDFRLPWLRARFPHVPVLYIHRNPRDQWVSIIRNQPSPDVDAPELNSGYDLVTWSANLYPYLPRIGSSEISSSYERVYLLSRMSEEIAKVYADCRIDFDREIQHAPEIGLEKLAGIVEVDPEQVMKLRPLLVERQVGGWRDYHDEAFFSEIEARCDDYLAGSGILEQIQQGTVFAEPASAIPPDKANGVIYPLVSEIARCRSALLQTVSRLNIDLANAQSHSVRLGEELGKVEQDAQAGFAERDQIVSKQKQYIASLETEIDKVVADAGVENAQRDKIIARQKQYTRSLQKELKKIRTEADAEVAGRDQIVSKQKQYIASLETEIDKVVADAGVENAQRDKIIANQKRYTRSLQKELEKLRIDADNGIEQRQQRIDKQNEFTFSLEKELEKIRTEADSEIAGRDRIVSEQKQYIASLETEVDKLRGDADEQILARDAVIEKNALYIASLETEMKKISCDAANEVGARDEMIQAKDRYIEALLAEVDTLRKSQG